jgi:hypothetical protein
VSDDANTLSGTETRGLNELCSSPRRLNWCIHFPVNTFICFLVHSVLLLLCICEASRDPSCIPCLESKFNFPFNLTMYARDPPMFVFLAGVDHELCDHTPPPFFIIVRESRGVLAKRMRCIFLWSVCPRGPLRLILSSASWNSGTSLLCAPDAPAPSVACPLDPGPSRALCQGRSVGDADDALCTNRQYVDMNRSFAALSNLSTCPFLIPRALWLYRKTRCGCRWGETETAC